MKSAVSLLAPNLRKYLVSGLNGYSNVAIGTIYCGSTFRHCTNGKTNGVDNRNSEKVSPSSTAGSRFSKHTRDSLKSQMGIFEDSKVSATAKNVTVKSEIIKTRPRNTSELMNFLTALQTFSQMSTKTASSAESPDFLRVFCVQLLKDKIALRSVKGLDIRCIIEYLNTVYQLDYEPSTDPIMEDVMAWLNVYASGNGVQLTHLAKLIFELLQLRQYAEVAEYLQHNQDTLADVFNNPVEGSSSSYCAVYIGLLWNLYFFTDKCGNAANSVTTTRSFCRHIHARMQRDLRNAEQLAATLTFPLLLQLLEVQLAFAVSNREQDSSLDVSISKELTNNCLQAICILLKRNHEETDFASLKAILRLTKCLLFSKATSEFENTGALCSLLCDKLKSALGIHNGQLTLSNVIEMLHMCNPSSWPSLDKNTGFETIFNDKLAFKLLEIYFVNDSSKQWFAHSSRMLVFDAYAQCVCGNEDAASYSETSAGSQENRSRLSCLDQKARDSFISELRSYPQTYDLWSPASVAIALRYSHTIDTSVAEFLFKQYFELCFSPLLQSLSVDSKSNAGATTSRSLSYEFLLPLCELPAQLSQIEMEVVLFVKMALPQWSVAEVLRCVNILATAAEKSSQFREDNPEAKIPLGARNVMREVAQLLCPYLERSSPAQLTELLYYYGKAEVFQTAFFDTASGRMKTFLTSPSQHRLTINEVGSAISVFASFDFKDTSLLVDAVPFVMDSLERGELNLEIATKLLSSYSTKLIWNFDLIIALANYIRDIFVRRVEMQTVGKNDKNAEAAIKMAPETIQLKELEYIIMAVLSLSRMDVPHPELFFLLSRRIVILFNTPEEAKQCSIYDYVAFLSVLSQLDLQHYQLRYTTINSNQLEFTVDPKVIDFLLDEILTKKESLAFPLICETLLALSRFHSMFPTSSNGEGSVSGKNEVPPVSPDQVAPDTKCALRNVPIECLEKFHLQTLAAVPTTSPELIEVVLRVYATMGKADVELFDIAADRLLAARKTIASSTLASILASYGKLNICNDRLFIELIPLLRHVTQFGTCVDITHVVYAYSRVNIWHYALFAKLADRAVQLRSEFSTMLLVELLASYAKVGMQYRKLFTGMEPRIESLANLFTLSEILSIVHSYALVDVKSILVLDTCTAQAMLFVDKFTEKEQAVELLDDIAKLEYVKGPLRKLLFEKFPEIESLYAENGTTDSVKETNVESETKGYDNGEHEAQ